jgi:hypothetical protein
MPEYTVKQGDCISSIAEQHGFTPDKIWDHPENTNLKKIRKDQNILFPGDIVFVPEKKEKEESGGTEQRHRFRRKGVPEKLRIILQVEGEPRANAEYIIDIDGEQSRGTTDDKGCVSISIPPGSQHGKLTILDGGEEFELALGGLDPIGEISGIQARLFNLGYNIDVTGKWDELSSEALMRFQSDHEINVTGNIDEETKSKLKSVYRS